MRLGGSEVADMLHSHWSHLVQHYWSIKMAELSFMDVVNKTWPTRRAVREHAQLYAEKANNEGWFTKIDVITTL